MSAVQCSIGSSKLIKEQIAEFVFEAAANQPASLTLWLEGGFYEQPEWPTGSDKEALGSAVSLKLTPPDSTTPVELFKGVLVARRIVIAEQRLRMQLHCQCSAMKAGEGVLAKAVKDKIKDDALIKDILETAGVTLSQAQASSSIESGQRVLPAVSPWLYARHLAAENGLLLLPLPDGLSLADPEKPAQEHAVKLATSGVLSMELGHDASHALAAVTVDAWDIKEQKTTASKAAEASGELKDVATKLGRSPLKIQRSDPVSKEACEAQAKARITRAHLAGQQGTLALADYFAANPGDSVTLDKVPEKFKTAFWIGGVNVTLDGEGLRTTLQLGLATERFDPPAPLPAPALMHGTIQPYKDDPEALQRLPVKLQGIAAPDNIVFARLLTPLAGKERGLYLPPQPEDEVIIGFLGESRDHPLILGAVHNPKQLPPFPYADKAPQHALVLEKDKLQWLFDAKEKTLTLAASDKHLLTLADKDGLLLQQDKATLTLNKDITIHSGQKLLLKDEKSTLTFDGGGNVDIEPATSVNIK